VNIVRFTKYASQAPAEFFAVACEAYFVNRTMFTRNFPTLVPLLDAFFNPEGGTVPLQARVLPV